MSAPLLDRLRPSSTTRGRDGATAIVAATVIALALSGGLDRYQTDQLITMALLLAVAQAWNVLAGFAGQLSLGVSAFVGVGAYGTGILMTHTGATYLPAIVVSAGCGVVLAAALAVPLLRLRGDYFAIGTLAATLALQAWLLNWSFAGGSTGLTLPIDRLPDASTTARAAIVVAGVSLLFTWYVQHSGFGLRIRAIRDHEDAATDLGVSAFRHRFVVLVLTSGITATAGSLVALRQVSFEPVGMLGIGWTLGALLMTVVGGMATFWGPVVGVFVVYYLLTQRLEDYSTLSLIIEGALLVVLIRFAPRGLVPLVTATVRRVMARFDPPRLVGAAREQVDEPQ